MIVYRDEKKFCGPISTLKKLDNGELVLVFREALWRGFSTHGDPTTKTSMIRSTDDGVTWHSKVTPDCSGAQGVSINQLSDGVLIVNNFHIRFIHQTGQTEITKRLKENNWPSSSILDGIYVTRSIDSGRTWENERRIETPVAFPSTAGRIVEINEETLLMPIAGTNSQSEPHGVWALGSDDKGDNWYPRGTVISSDDPDIPDWGFSTDIVAEVSTSATRYRRFSNAGYHEPRLLALPSGRILIGMRAAMANFFTAYSDDGAKTWSRPAETPIYCNGSSPFDLLLLEDGRVLATYGHRRPPWGVRACLSEDEGRTWRIEKEIVLRDDGLDRDMGYPSSQQLDNGSILTVYYWHNEDQIRHLVSTKWDIY